jgi:hypothetical protein
MSVPIRSAASQEYGDIALKKNAIAITQWSQPVLDRWLFDCAEATEDRRSLSRSSRRVCTSS